MNYGEVVKRRGLERKRFKRINKKVTVAEKLAIEIFISYSITMGANCLILPRVKLYARNSNNASMPEPTNGRKRGLI